MVLSELTAYAKEEYGIEEQHRWAEFPGFSVLCHPRTGKWVALLMRQWDTDTGTEIQCCDLKCGRDDGYGFGKRYLSAPLRMHGPKWVNVSFDGGTEPEVVFRLFDRAISSGEPHGYTIVLDRGDNPSETAWRDTPLPFENSGYRPPPEETPDRIRQMRRICPYGRESMGERARNFYRQAKFMEDYEDDAPWEGDFVCYYPTYNDLNTRQLRGYFAWRARVRRGEYLPIAASAAYIYVYELLGGVGAESTEDSLKKLKAFESGFLDSGIGDTRMRPNLRRWMLELAVVNDLPAELARQYAEPKILENDGAIAVLRSPEEHTDEEVCTALFRFGERKLLKSPVLAHGSGKGARLFAQAWRSAAAGYISGEKDLFSLCFGEPVTRPWYPLANAVYFRMEKPRSMEYVLDECRSYRCTYGVWQSRSYEKHNFDTARLRGFLHETELKLRRWLKTGRSLAPDPADAWADPFIDAVIEADRKTEEEAARPRITIDFSGLDRIREESVATRDSLLTGEEAPEPEVQEEPEDAASPPPERFYEEYVQGLCLEGVYRDILRSLLRGEGAEGIVRDNHLMPSVAADSINEALFDEIGDVAVLCEDDKLSLVEDYRDDVARMLGGT